jgi:hypothetical protein
MKMSKQKNIWERMRLKPFFTEQIASLKRFSKYGSMLSFIDGFSWDTVTLGRIDRIVDNFILLSYIISLAVLIILHNLVKHGVLQQTYWENKKHYLVYGIQFLFGGLFSAYVIYYSQSAAFSKTDIFLFILIILFVANEFMRERFNSVYMQFGLYFLALCSFLTFFLPIVFKQMHVALFIAAGLLSLLIIAGLVKILHRLNAFGSKSEIRITSITVLGIYVIFNLFYFLNWIPPVPLSLKYGVISHHVKRVENNYLISVQKAPFNYFWMRYNPKFQYIEGDTVFCFTAIFAPTKLKTAIYHHWQMWDVRQQRWLTTDRINYAISGGRDDGYRGYSYKTAVTPGKWRVDVETQEGKLLSRLSFEIIPVDTLINPLKVIWY